MISGSTEVLVPTNPSDSKVFVFTIDTSSSEYKFALKRWEKDQSVSERTLASLEEFHKTLVVDKLESETWPSLILRLTDFALTKTDAGTELSVCFDELPKIDLPAHLLNPTQDANYGHLPPLTEADYSAAVETAWASIKQKHAMLYEDPEHLVVELGDWVVLDSISKRSGDLWKAGCFVNQKHHVIDGALKPKSLLTELIGKSKGNHKLVLALDEQFGILAGQMVEMDLTIKSILINKIPTNEELLELLREENPKLTFAELTDRIVSQTRKTVYEKWERDAAKHLLTQVVSEITIPEFPRSWIEAKKDQLKEQLAKSDLRIAPSTVDSIVHEEVMIEAITVAVLFNYGLATGITRQRNTPIGEYLYQCMRRLLERHQLAQ
jgi:hypothetical protein